MKVLEEKKSIAKEIIKASKFKHAAIIMDGNRRWAKERHLPTAFGHKEGVKALKETLRAADDLGIEYITVYAFSTENWNRTTEEVEFLMDLLAHTLKNELNEMHENGIAISFIGDIKQLKPNLQEILKDATVKTKNNKGVKLQIAFNYGSRMEIVNAVKKLATKIQSNEILPNEITEELFEKELYTSNIPDPDLLIRTGGEMRISNYLLWQIAYSEIYVTEKYWPEFGAEELAEAIIEFGKRSRRWGK